MPEIIRASGLRIIVPAAYRVEDPGAGASVRRAALRQPRPSGPIPISSSTGGGETETLLQALREQDMRLVDTIELVPELQVSPPPAPRGAPAPGAPDTQRADVDLEVGIEEDAVLLAEQDGVYSWHVPEGSDGRHVPPPPGVRPGRRGPLPRKVVRFSVEIHVVPRGPAPSRRGILTDIVFDRIKIYALKFVARLAVGQAVQFLERNIRRGLVSMAGLDPAAWGLTGPSAVTLPTDRPARILVFIPGTFSSTIGSYGALCGTPWGQAFLAAARAEYDAVLGFDHATLSDDPVTNASALLAALEALRCRQPPNLDVVAFSRGGLVYRALVEHLLPKAGFACRMNRAIFVACPNRGTVLAEPENWKTLVELYTNIAVASFRLLSLIPPATAASLILKELVQSLGALVKHIAAAAGEDVPGLAAMRPQGEFIRTLNQTQAGQPTPATIRYYAVTAEFKPVLREGDHKPRELPRRLALALADGLIDRVINEANDLVVNTASMTAMDESTGPFIQDVLAFGTTPLVYHTAYFTRPEVVNALTRWLELPTPEVPAPAPRGRRRGAVAPGVVAIVSRRLTATFRSPAPVRMDTDIVFAEASATAKDATDMIAQNNPSYVVVSRDVGGERLHYAMRTEEVLERVRGVSDRTLLQALDLHETERSRPIALGDVQSAPPPTSSIPHARRGVVVVNGQPLGVIPAAEDAATMPDIVELARIVSAPRTPEESAMARRAMPTFAAGPPPPPTPMTCHFTAEVEQEVLLNHTATIEVMIAREAIAVLAGRASAKGRAEVDPTRTLIVQVVPKANFLLGDDGTDRREVDPPAGGEPITVYFDVKAAHPGEGEVWILVRQRQMVIASLVLRPRVVDRQTAATRSEIVEARAAEAPPLAEPLDQLLIVEQAVGSEVHYFFELELPLLGVLATFYSDPLKMPRDTYVKNLYKEIEDRYLSHFDAATNTADVEAFTAELRSYGADLFGELFPPQMQQLLWRHRTAIASIRVVSTEPFIPWELVHLREPGKALDSRAAPTFLGQMGLVRWLHNVDGLPPTTLRIRRDRARYVIPDYPLEEWRLPEAAEERAYLVKTFQASAVDPQPNPVRALLETPGTFDLLHFACHGEADHDDISRARVVLQGRVEGPNFVPTHLGASIVENFAQLRGRDGSRPVVVLNACQVGRGGYKLTGIGGFAHAFTTAGAGLFVGTLWSVGDTPARVFTEAFYEKLLAGDTVAAATTAARAEARQAGDATWLAYVVYGHPQARLTRE